MVTIRRKIASLVLAVVTVAGLGVVTAAPAQAFSTFNYTANCPGNARGQQLVIRNYSGTHVRVDYWPNHPFGPYRGGEYALPSGISYIQYWANDTVLYQMSGNGNLNWYYHVDCFY